MNHKLNIRKINLEKILGLSIEPCRLSDLKSKLEIFAVKSEIKLAFLELFPGDNIHRFKKVARLLDLHYKETNIPPPHFIRKPCVKSSFLKALVALSVAGKQSIWIYSDTRVESMISQCIAGELNDGHILGYPECCVRWHEQNRAPETESCFKDIEDYLTKNPQAYHDIRAETEEEIYKSILSHWQNPFPRYALETYRRYPFVPHWACPSCLSGESEESRKLNGEYKQLAINLDPKFAEEIIHEASTWLNNYYNTLKRT